MIDLELKLQNASSDAIRNLVPCYGSSKIDINLFEKSSGEKWGKFAELFCNRLKFCKSEYRLTTKFEKRTGLSAYKTIINENIELIKS